jgi:predicted cation transporter
MVFAVLNSHNAASLVLGMLFFLAFVEVTEEYQRDFSVRPPMLVGFFLAGLVIHGGLQQWWIAPILGGLGEFTLMLTATTLTAFNDNAAITYLCTLVPTFTEGMKYAAVAGAVAGGGLTVIANAPNPAGQSILRSHFEEGISALGLLKGSLIPTAIMIGIFMLFHY